MSEPLEDARRIQSEAAAEGFDWPADASAALWAKLQEEILELQQADDLGARAEELGDLLFMVVNLARHLHLDPAAALSAANRKFERRFGHIMAQAHALPPIGDPARLDAMEALWREAKAIERR